MQDKVLENNIKAACQVFFDLQKNDVDLNGYLASLFIFQVIGENAKQLTQEYLSHNPEINKALKAEVVGQGRGINFFREIRNDNAHMTSISLDESYLQYLHSYIKSIYVCLGGEVTVDPKFSTSLQNINAEYIRNNAAQPYLEIRKLMFLARNIRESSGKIIAQTLVSQTLGNLVDSLYEDAEENIKPLLGYAKRKRHESAHNIELPVGTGYTPPLDLLEAHYGRLEVIVEPSVEVGSSSSSATNSMVQVSTNTTSKKKGKKATSSTSIDLKELENNEVYKKNKEVSAILELISKHDYATLSKKPIDWLYPVRYMLQSDTPDKTIYHSVGPNHSIVLLRDNPISGIEDIKLPQILYLNVFGVFCQTMFTAQLKATQKSTCLRLIQQGLDVADVNTTTISNNKVFESLIVSAISQKDYATFREIIDLLMKNNANINLASSAGVYALLYALRMRNNDLLTQLTEKGANFHDIKIISINASGKREAVSIATRFGIDSYYDLNPFSSSLINGVALKDLVETEIQLCIPKNGDTTFLSSALWPLFVGDMAKNLKNDAIQIVNSLKDSREVKQTQLNSIEGYFTRTLSALHSIYQAIQRPDTYLLHCAVIFGRCKEFSGVYNPGSATSLSTPGVEVTLYDLSQGKEAAYKLNGQTAEQLAVVLGRSAFYKTAWRYYANAQHSSEDGGEKQEILSKLVGIIEERTR